MHPSGNDSRRIVRVMAVPLCAFLVAAVSLARAADYPDRAVRLVVPFAPGGPVDIMARAIAQRLHERWSQPVIVENRAGAGGGIGSDLVARASPDGYTLLTGHVGTHAINASLYRKLAYDPIKDFAPVTLIATLPLALVVHPSLPARNVRQLIELARARPGEINFASAGAGGPTHLAGEVFKAEAGIDIVHVPYKGNAAALADVVSGQSHMMFSNLLTSTPLARAGKLRALAIGSPKRSVLVPDLPTIAESGLPGFDATPWYGILAPAGTPRPIVDKLSRDIAQVLAAPDMQSRFGASGIDLVASSPDDFGALIRREIPRWAAVVKRSGASAN